MAGVCGDRLTCRENRSATVRSGQRGSCSNTLSTCCTAIYFSFGLLEEMAVIYLAVTIAPKRRQSCGLAALASYSRPTYARGGFWAAIQASVELLETQSRIKGHLFQGDNVSLLKRLAQSRVQTTKAPLQRHTRHPQRFFLEPFLAPCGNQFLSSAGVVQEFVHKSSSSA